MMELNEKEIKKVLITGASGQVAYSFLQPLICGLAFGTDQPLHLVLFDLPDKQNILEGIKIELEDCASFCPRVITVTASPEVAFDNIDFMVGLACCTKPTDGGVSRVDLVRLNQKLYEEHGRMIEQYAKKTVKILIVADPCNTMALVLQRNAPSIPVKNITCLTRLEQDRTKHKVARKLGYPACYVTRVIIWGNHSLKMVPDVTFSLVKIGDTKFNAAKKIIRDGSFWTNFFNHLWERGALVQKLLQKSNALSTGLAIINHIRDWIEGTPKSEYASMGVYSTGCYGVPEGIFCSFPCKCKDEEYHIEDGLPLDPKIKELLKESVKELIEERDALIG